MTRPGDTPSVRVFVPLVCLLACAQPDAPAAQGVAPSTARVARLDADTDCAAPPTPDTDTDTSDDTDHGSPEHEPYDIRDFADVESCAGCHPDQYDEWQGSIHAYSATNPVMWEGSRHIGETTDQPLNCVGCHAPIATLTAAVRMDQTVSAKSRLPEAAQHGVSCVSCHKLYDVYEGVNQFTHCADHYFGTIADPLETSAHGSQHSPIHEQALVCRSCHNVENLHRVQVEFTYSEWLEQNFAAGGTEAAPAIQTCQDCHMPAYTGRAAVGGPDRTLHRHTFIGADVALTPFPDSHRQYREVEALMRTAASLALTPIVGDAGLGAVEVAVTNLVEGHDLPSGSAFDRQVWIELYVTDGEGRVLLESGALDANGDLKDWNSALEPNADPWVASRQSVFRSYLSDELGAETFDFIGAARSVSDDSLAAGETRDVRYAFDATGATWPIVVEARLLYRPYPPFLLREHGLDTSVVDAIPIFEVAAESLVIEEDPR